MKAMLCCVVCGVFFGLTVMACDAAFRTWVESDGPDELRKLRVENWLLQRQLQNEKMGHLEASIDVIKMRVLLAEIHLPPLNLPTSPGDQPREHRTTVEPPLFDPDQ